MQLTEMLSYAENDKQPPNAGVIIPLHDGADSEVKIIQKGSDTMQ